MRHTVNYCLTRFSNLFALDKCLNIVIIALDDLTFINIFIFIKNRSNLLNEYELNKNYITYSAVKFYDSIELAAHPRIRYNNIVISHKYVKPTSFMS